MDFFLDVALLVVLGMKGEFLPELFLSEGQLLEVDCEVLLLLHEFLCGLCQFLGISLFLLVNLQLVEVLGLLLHGFLLLNLLEIELPLPLDLTVQLFILLIQHLQISCLLLEFLAVILLDPLQLAVQFLYLLVFICYQLL